MKTLGERIRELREAKDMSLRELAAAIDVSAAFMSDVELGRRYPSDKHLAALATALETSTDDLGKYDTRPPIQEFRRMTVSNPEYGFAFRQMIDKKVSPGELLKFLEERDKQQGREGRDKK
jgi:transcriptional regulator with XRE-family HTH domain